MGEEEQRKRMRLPVVLDVANIRNFIFFIITWSIKHPPHPTEHLFNDCPQGIDPEKTRIEEWGKWQDFLGSCQNWAVVPGGTTKGLKTNTKQIRINKEDSICSSQTKKSKISWHGSHLCFAKKLSSFPLHSPFPPHYCFFHWTLKGSKAREGRTLCQKHPHSLPGVTLGFGRFLLPPHFSHHSQTHFWQRWA